MIIFSDRKGCFAHKLIYEDCSLWLQKKFEITPEKKKFFYFIIASALAELIKFIRMSVKLCLSSNWVLMEMKWIFKDALSSSQSSLKFWVLSNRKFLILNLFIEREKKVNFDKILFSSDSWIFVRRAYFSIKDINYAHIIRIFSNYCWCRSSRLHMSEICLMTMFWGFA